jgi:phosphotransferase system enzyme I (PtsP)
MGCEIVSIYLREKGDGGEALRMAGNIGFPAGAISKVRLAIGEGIVGHVAENLRPVSLELAPTDPHYVAFPELGEERYPIFLAVPLLVGRRAEGVMVLQRAFDRFSSDEVVLATALAISFVYALERARVRRSEIAPSKESRRVRLEGTKLSSGTELGRVETLPTFEGLAALWRARDAKEREQKTSAGSGQDDAESALLRAREVRNAFETLVRDLTRARKRVAPKLSESHRRALDSLALLETDSRFIEALAEEAARSGDVPLALRKVAREYAQAPYRGAMADSVQGWLADRSEEVEELCLLLAARATGERVPRGGSALLVPERLSAVVALAAVAHKSAAIAVGNQVDRDALGPAVVRAAAIPALSGVGGLFAWARAGDIVLVDAEEGVVRVNPSANTIARFRKEGREAAAKEEENA